jgi:putative transposase
VSNRPVEPSHHALGRSRGGLTTKIHALADLACDLVALRLTPGQAGDNPRLLGLLDDWLDNGGLDATEIELLADKAYSHPSTRRELGERGITHTIPERKDQIARREAAGPDAGPAPLFDPRRYAQRNTVERGFGRLKQWRGIATRYDKYALTYLGGALLGSAIMVCRSVTREPPSEKTRTSKDLPAPEQVK